VESEKTQNPAIHEIEIELKTEYKLTIVMSSGDTSTILPGTVLVVQPGMVASSRP